MSTQRKRRTLTDLFLDELKKLSNEELKFVSNKTLREALSWKTEKYDRIKQQLVEQQLITVGKGYGGSVSLADVNETKALSIFISYSHEDEALKKSLEKHLTPLKHLKLVETWDYRKIKAGEAWENSISNKLESSDIVLLLISIDFINSEYCNEVEFERALELKENGKTEIVPIILRACMWKHTPFNMFQVLPKDGKPVTSYTNQDEAFAEIAEGIRQTAIRIKDSR